MSYSVVGRYGNLTGQEKEANRLSKISEMNFYLLSFLSKFPNKIDINPKERTGDQKESNKTKEGGKSLIVFSGGKK